MAKYLLTITVDTYWDYVIEAPNEQEAWDRAVVDFVSLYRDTIRPDIEIEEVPEETKLGDA